MIIDIGIATGYALPLVGMKSFRPNPRILLACVLVAAALVAGTRTFLRESGKMAGEGIHRTTHQEQGKGPPSSSIPRPTVKNRPIHRQAGDQTDREAEKHLRTLIEKDDLQSIQSELAARAENKSLSAVAGVLRDLSREGAMELAQWCLVLSEESDPALHLRLCAEALSNPSDVIRSLAASRLEEATGHAFQNSFEAAAWLEKQASH